MAETVTSEAAPAADKTSGGRRWWIVAAIAVAVVVVAGGAWAIVANQDDDTPNYDTSQIGWMHQGCQQWTASYQGSNGPNTAWCTSMTDWMNGRMSPNASSGNGMMMGSMMWQSPASMQSTCEQWMATNPDGVPSGADTAAWCGQMVDWMDQHMGGWDNWMHDGPMMGGN